MPYPPQTPPQPPIQIPTSPPPTPQPAPHPWQGRWAFALYGLVLGLLLGLLAVGTPAHAAPRTVVGSAVIQTYDYGPARLTAHYDNERTNAPWIVEVHGGWWRTGTEDSDYGIAERFRARGYQVFTVDYRKSAEAPWPAQRQDVAESIKWIRARAGTFGIDPANVALLGGSAGGHIAVSTAAQLPAGQKVKATVGLAAINDLWALWLGGHASTSTAATKGMDNATLLVGCSRVESASCDARWVDTWSVYRFDQSDGRLADWQCDADPTIPLYQGQRMISKAQGAGVRAEMHVVDCATHNVLSATGVEAQVSSYLAGVLHP